MRLRPAGLALAAVLAIAALTACGQDRPAPSPSASPSASADAIRHFDLAESTWRQPMLNPTLRARTERGDPTIRLHGGLARGQLADGGGEVTCHLVDSPVYGDLGDGVQSLAAGLNCQAGNGDYTAWYVWRWDAAKHTAVQGVEPLVSGERCGDEVRTVAYGHRALTITVGLANPQESCADMSRNRTAYTYTVALRDGHLMRVSPVKGALRECATVTGDVRSVTGVTLYVTRDAHSPVVYRASGATTLWSVPGKDYYEPETDLTGAATHWQFVRAKVANGYVCGYRKVSS
ncbi:MAG TPA: hypothetical protein VGN37_18565 [Actinocatenispora sp.]